MTTFRKGDKGPQIDLLQSTLKKLGFYHGEIDGIFGLETENAVKKFQEQAGITVDGIAGPDTFDKLFPYINGYALYRVVNGDTFYNIAQKFQTKVAFIVAANPTVDPNNLQIGTILVIPIGNVVPTDVRYTSTLMQANVNALSAVYPFLETGIIGNSILSVDIPYIRIGRGEKEVFYNASIHGNEWITSVLLMKFAEDYCKSLVLNGEIYGYDSLKLYDEVSIYIVPMVNPDGVDLVTNLLQPGNEIYDTVKNAASRYPMIPFPNGWKANIRGVDLDLQFPANWEKAVTVNAQNGFRGPAPSNFPGPFVLSEPESYALYNFTLKHNFKLTLSYHTDGKLIYWRYNNLVPPNSEQIARQLADVSGYKLADAPLEYSNATYQNWFIQDFNKPGYIIKVGVGENPIGLYQFNQIYNENIGLLVYAAIL